MMQLDMGMSSRRVWIWRGELPEARYEPAKVQSLRVPPDAQASVTANQAAIDFRAIAGPRGYYGLLGAEFTPNETPELTVEVATSGRDAPSEEGAR